MNWRLLRIAESRFRKIEAPRLAAEVYRGTKFEDGVKASKSMRRSSWRRSKTATSLSATSQAA
jgi:hypothetical protein